MKISKTGEFELEVGDMVQLYDDSNEEYAVIGRTNNWLVCKDENEVPYVFSIDDVLVQLTDLKISGSVPKI